MEKEATKQAEEKTKITDEVMTQETEEVDFMVVELSKKYKFEGQEITEVDLNALENLTGTDMIAINRMMKKRGNTDASPEMTMEFAFFAAFLATGLPLEFFYQLNAKDSMRIKSRVNYFLMY